MVQLAWQVHLEPGARPMERDWMALLPELIGGLLVMAGGAYGAAFRWMYYLGAGLMLGAIARLDNFVDMGALGFTWSMIANGLAMACYVWMFVLVRRLSREARGQRG